MDGNVRSISNCPSIAGHQVLDGNVSSTSIRPAIVSHPSLNDIVGNACKRPKYCYTKTCRRQLVRYASKRTGIVDHRFINGNARSTSTCPSIVSHQILDSNVGNASKRPSIVGNQLLHGSFGNAFKRPSIVSHQFLDAGADLGGGCRGCAPPPEMTCGFLIQLVFCKNYVVYWC